MKNNISFYSHKTVSHHHWKFKALRREYGWEGEGRFWALNNMIGDAENCLLDVSTINRKKAVSAELDMTVEEFEKYIKYLSEDCELISLGKDFISTENTQEILKDVNLKREKEREKKRKYSQVSPRENKDFPRENKKSAGKTGKFPREKQQSKVNKSKVNKSKEEQTKECARESEFLFDDFWELYDKKVGEKSKLENKWAALTEAEKLQVFTHVPLYKISQPEKRYRKDPETYLNNKSFNDEIIFSENGKSTQQNSKHQPALQPKHVDPTQNWGR